MIIPWIPEEDEDEVPMIIPWIPEEIIPEGRIKRREMKRKAWSKKRRGRRMRYQ